MTATVVIQPIDMIKVRIQSAGEGVATGPKPTPLSVTREILAEGKVMDLYTGLSAGLLRQAVYTTARLGLFDTFMKSLTARSAAAGRKVGFSERATAGLAAGGLAAIISNPADLALIRMQTDGKKPLAERANYRGVGDALTRIARNEGLAALWTGWKPTVARAMALNFGQLAFFSEAKQQLKDTSLGPRTQTLTASAIAGFFASFFSLPFDFVKTRMQKQGKAVAGPPGTPAVRPIGMLGAFAKIAREEGIFRFYRGFGTYYFRVSFLALSVPHLVVRGGEVTFTDTSGLTDSAARNGHAHRGGLPWIHYEIEQDNPRLELVLVAWVEDRPVEAWRPAPGARPFSSPAPGRARFIFLYLRRALPRPPSVIYVNRLRVFPFHSPAPSAHSF